MTKPRRTAAPSGGGLPPVAFLCGRPCWREDGTRFQKRSPRRIFRQVLLLWAGPRKPGTAKSAAEFLLDPRKFPGAPPGADGRGPRRRRADRATKKLHSPLEFRHFWFLTSNSRSFYGHWTHSYPVQRIRETFVSTGLSTLDLGQFKPACSHHTRRVLEKISYVGLYFLRSSSIAVCWRSIT